MNNKVLIAEIVDFYWELDDTIESMAGNLEETVPLRDLQIKLDKILTNSSKRWARGKKASKTVQRKESSLY